MKVLHLIGGGDVGGAKFHVLSLVKELSKYIDVKIVSFRPGMFSDEAMDMGIDIEIVKSGNFIRDARRVIRMVREGGYDVVHSHGAKANMFSALIKGFTGVPTVTTVHSDYRLDYLQSVFKMFSFGLINTVALRFVDYYIAVSNNFKQMLISRNFKAPRIFTVYNGISFDNEIPEYPRETFIEKFRIDLKEEDVAVGILARLHPVKGVDIFVRAAKEVVDRNPRVKFLIGGDGEERKALERKAASLGISENVYFLGFVTNPYEFMSNIDINILSSISESFPYSILEGTRLKKATISSNVGGISDLIESGINGYLFEAGDYKKLAEYIIELVENPAERKEMGQRLYEKAKAQFSLGSMCDTQLGIYRKILENK